MVSSKGIEGMRMWEPWWNGGISQAPSTATRKPSREETAGPQRPTPPLPKSAPLYAQSRIERSLPLLSLHTMGNERGS